MHPGFASRMFGRKEVGAVPSVAAERWVHLFFYAAIMLVTALLKGYRFGTSDHYSQLVIHYHMFDRSYLPNDWYVNANAGFSIRDAYGFIPGVLSLVIGWPAAYLVVHVITWYLVFDGIVRIAVATTGRRRVGYVAAALAIAILSNDTLGKNVWGAVGVPRELARGLGLFGLWAWLGSRWMLGGAFLGAAMTVHVFSGGELAGLLIAAVVVEALVARNASGLRGVWKGIAAWAIVGAPALVMLGASMLATGGAAPGELRLAAIIDGIVRDAHHTLPHVMPRASYATHLVELSVAAFAWAAWRPAPEGPALVAWRRLGWLLVVTILAMAAAAFFTEIVLVPFIATATVFMNSFWLRVGSAIAMALVFDEALASRRRGYLAVTAAACVGIVALSFTHAHSPFAHAEWVLDLVMLGLLLGLLGRAGWWQGLERHARGATLTAVLLLVGVFGLSHALRRVPPAETSPWYPLWRHTTYNLSITYPRLEPGEEELVEWARAHTPPRADFLVPPLAEWFRLRAERAVVFDWKAIPYQPQTTIEWFARLQAVTNDSTPPLQWKGGLPSRPRIAAEYTALPPDLVVRVARRYGADYVVRERTSAPLDLPLVFDGRTYRVYEMPGPRR